MSELVNIDVAETIREESEWQAPKLGEWVWVSDVFANDGKPVRPLACVVEIGSNYCEVNTVNGSSVRIHFDRFDAHCEREPHPQLYIQRKIALHQDRVRELMDEIRHVTAQLGIAPIAALADHAQEQAQALAVASGTADIKAHKAALIKAKKETLPDLFKAIEREHDKLSKWMKANLMPAKAQLSSMRIATSAIEDRIFTVELYAGLVESLVQIAKGEAAPNDTPIYLFQRRHYMDEECLVNYQAGGMSFDSINDFDRWLCKRENRDRILPMPRSVVALRVRRHSREFSGGDSLRAFIRFQFETEHDKQTFLYIRNGEQIFRLMTGIEFDEQLFPDLDHDLLFNQQTAWILDNREPVSQRAYDYLMAKYNRDQALADAKQRAWERAGEPRGQWKYDDEACEDFKRIDPDGEATIYNTIIHDGRLVPNGYNHGEPWDHVSEPKLEPLTTDSVYYDDAMEHIRAAVKQHNRISVVLQGLLDRSPAFQPHPPWRLWTPEGFELAIRLMYDESRGLTNGDPPDFEAYRARLNKHIKVGSITVGQDDAWQRHEADKANARDHRRNRDYERYKPYGNPGPGMLARVEAIDRKEQLVYRWIRTHLRDSSWRSGSYPTEFRCASEHVLNVSAYQSGDFKIFYEDPRTRADYLQWAPLLLVAEDYVNGKRKIGGDDE